MKRQTMGLACAVLLCLLPSPGTADTWERPELELHSPSFRPYGMIPAKYTCDGEDISPVLWWTGVPLDTRSFVLIFEDIDDPGGHRAHWLWYDLPAALRHIPERIASVPRPALGGVHGKNGFGEIGYRGPCHPAGNHRCCFRLYALDALIGLEPGASRKDVERAMEGHVLDEASLMGMYGRIQ